MFGWLKKKSSAASKKKALVFVDYEHWYISMEKLHAEKPDIRSWYAKLTEEYDVRDVLFFADFSNTALRLEIPRIREVTSTTVDTQNTAHFKKDFTDFIMLDHIYQKAFHADGIDAFILFSGDGHFSSAATFLRAKCGKEVGVFAVRGAASSVLKNSADWMVEYPPEKDPNQEIYSFILSSLIKLEDGKAEKGKKVYPTFRATVEAVSRNKRLPRKKVAEAMRSLIEKEVVTQQEETTSSLKSLKTVRVRRDKAKDYL